VGVGGPRIGVGETGGERAKIGRGGSPESEGAVDVDQRAGSAGVAADRGDGIEGAGVHVAGLGDYSVWKKAKEQMLKPGASWTVDILKELAKHEVKQRFGIPEIG